jgi:HlyD family secretion protein/macrolide-specific efflux system membrane fusion protein
MNEEATNVRAVGAARRTRRRWPWIVAAVLLAVGVGAVVRARGSSGKPLDATLIVAAKRGDLPIDVIETGKVQPREKVEVKSKVAGQVARVFVEEGQKVKRGQLLLAIDPTDFRRDVARSQADVARAAADVRSAGNALAFARLNLARRQKGFEGRGVAQMDVDVAESDVKARAAALGTSQAVLAGARVALSAAEDRLRYTRIVAPMDGTVIERGIQPGEVVTPGVQATFEGKALLTVADLSTLVVKADLNQIDVAKVKLDQTVTLTLDALPGKTWHARVTKIAPASTVPKGKDVDVFPIEATLTDASREIKPGMTADVRVHVDVKKDVVSLPIEAIVKEAGKTLVNKVVPGERGRERTDKIEVTTASRNDREVEVQKGIAAGDRVLIKPASSSENEYK